MLLSSSLNGCCILRVIVLLPELVASLEGQSSDSSAFDKLVKPDIGLSSEAILTIVSGLYRLIQLALRFSESSLKPEVCTDYGNYLFIMTSYTKYT